MNFFKKFFGQSSDSNNEILFERIKQDYENKNFSSVIEQGKPLVNRLKDVQRIELDKMIALSYFNENNMEEALPFFYNVAVQKNSSVDWFNVATTSILCKQIDKGMDAFGKAIELNQKDESGQSLSVGQMSLYIMQALKDIESFDLAFVQMIKFKDAYTHLKITDDHFLFVRGLPSVRQVLMAGKEIIEKQKIYDGNEWLNDFADKIDEEGRQFIKEFQKNLNYAN